LPHEMEQDQQPQVFPYNLIKMGKDLFEKFKKKPLYTTLAGSALVGLVFYLLLTYMLNWCLLPMIPPFLMLAVFWMLDIKRARLLLVAGIVACTVLLVVATVFFVNMYNGIEPVSAYSNDDGMTLRNGVVNPLEGDALTPFNYTLDVYVDESTPVTNVTVIIAGFNSFRNESMTAMPREASDNFTTYYYTTTLSDPVNQFVFWADVNGTWYFASDYVDGVESAVIGPVYTSSWEVAKPVMYYAAIQSYVQFFMIYALLVGMIWWTRRARRMRVKQMEQWEAKRKEAAAQTPKDEAKVPSLSKAMGLESDDTFVCSECGADVQADATECPKCGEKFE
jgi:hypothetical protein